MVLLRVTHAVTLKLMFRLSEYVCGRIVEKRIWVLSLLLLEELIIIVLIVVTAAGVVPCGIHKKRPRTSSIVQFIYICFLWSLEMSRDIL